MKQVTLVHNDSRRFVVLDRDGTIIKDTHYLDDPDKIEFLPGAIKGMLRLQELGLGLAIITNQSGVGRGYFSLDTLGLIHERLLNLLKCEGISIDGIYYCPHMPDENCNCRKPRTDLIKTAARELNFDLASCFVIGDKNTDIELGQRVGAATVLVTGDSGGTLTSEKNADSTFIVAGLGEAAEIITGLL